MEALRPVLKMSNPHLDEAEVDEWFEEVKNTVTGLKNAGMTEKQAVEMLCSSMDNTEPIIHPNPNPDVEDLKLQLAEIAKRIEPKQDQLIAKVSLGLLCLIAGMNVGVMIGRIFF